MAERYPLVSSQSTLTIEELPVGDTLVADYLRVLNNGNIVGNLYVGGSLTVDGNIDADLGNLVVENLTVEGKTNLGSVGNITISGGSNNYVLRTNGAGNLTWANIQSEIANPGGSNTFVQINDNGLFGASANFTFNKNTNVLSVQGTANLATVNTDNLNVSVGNLHVSGGSNGYVLATDGSSNLSWVQIDPSVSGDGGNATSSVLLVASLVGGNAVSS
jgi:hypothetical protein